MSNKTFFKIAGLILFVGLVYFVVTPKYVYIKQNPYNGHGIKFNKMTGEAYEMKNGLWIPVKKEPSLGKVPS